MGRCIVKIRDMYLEWSSIVDAPVSYGLPLAEFKETYLNEYGEGAAAELEQRLERVERTGTSMIRPETTAAELIAGNRAGKNERTLTEDELYTVYCLRRALTPPAAPGEPAK